MAWRANPHAGRGLSLPHLIGGEGALWQARVAEADLNFGDAVATNARANGKGQAVEDKLEIRDLQPFRRHRYFALGRKPGGLEIDPKSQPGLSGADAGLWASRIDCPENHAPGARGARTPRLSRGLTEMPLRSSA